MGRDYELEFNTNLATANWTALGSVSATDSIMSWSDVSGSDRERFFRVFLQP